MTGKRKTKPKKETAESKIDPEFRKKMENVKKLTDKQLLAEKIEVLSALDSVEDEIEYCDGRLSQKNMLSFYLSAIEWAMKERGLKK